ncbi:phage tail protein, partial [Citrobacter freundii]
VRLGAGAPPIGIPFFWPSSVMPNAVMTEWSDMVFLKFNGASFSAATYPRLALAVPGLVLPDARGDFPRIWDDGRGVDSGRTLLSVQGDASRNITGAISPNATGKDSGTWLGVNNGSGALKPASLSGNVGVVTNSTGTGASGISLDISRVVPTADEFRPRNIAFNLLVRAK